VRLCATTVAIFPNTFDAMAEGSDDRVRRSIWAAIAKQIELHPGHVVLACNAAV